MSFRLLLSAITSLSLAGGAFATVHTFELNMTGDQEAPGPGDPDGFASGSLTIDDVTNMISWSFTYENIDAPTLMHIHTGAKGVPGPVFVNLGVATSGGPGTLISSTVTTAGNVAMILADPAGYYVNIHNAPFPAGAIRGQLTPVVTVHTFELMMTGDQEVPGPGDRDGIGAGTLVIDDATNEITWSITYENIDPPTLMHIHTGAAGVPGPVLVNLGVATSGGPGTLISSTVASEANIKLILADPAGFYVNIHNAPFPAGAIRSQLLRLSDNCLGDFNGDGVVDGSDLGLLLGDWGGTEFDLNDDGAVDGSDLGILLGAWGDCVT